MVIFILIMVILEIFIFIMVIFILIKVPTSLAGEQSKPLVRHWPYGRARRLHCKTPAILNSQSALDLRLRCLLNAIALRVEEKFDVKIRYEETDLDAVAVGVEEKSKLFNKLSRHQLVPQLWYLVQMMMIQTIMMI